MSHGKWGNARGSRGHGAARLPTLVAVLLAAGAIGMIAPATSLADVTFGSTLDGAADTTKSATADSVYWAKLIDGGTQSPTAPADGQVKSVTIRGNWDGTGSPTILFQVLRPQPDGSFMVIATSEPFTLSSTPGTYTFMPTNMLAKKGDYIGVATLSGGFKIAATDNLGSDTYDFTGHNQDMNGDSIKPTVTEADIELLLQVDLVPTPPPTPMTTSNPPPTIPMTVTKPKPPPKKKHKKCKCARISVKIDPTLLNKAHIRADKQDFGVGFTWRMTCSPGNLGGCSALLTFSPPKVLAGSVPVKNALRLNLKRMSFLCKSACQTSTQGRFQIKMLSRGQLNQLFGRTLAFTIHTFCNGQIRIYRVRVFVDSMGVLRPAH